MILTIALQWWMAPVLVAAVGTALSCWLGGRPTTSRHDMFNAEELTFIATLLGTAFTVIGMVAGHYI